MDCIALLTSGGDSPGMNTAIRSIVKVAAQRGVRCLGVEEGYLGLVEGRLRELTAREVDGIGSLGGTVLGSSRCAEFREPAGRARAAATLRDAGARGLVVIGGNGSLTGAHLLCHEQGVPVMGLPASIDNDIGCTSSSIGVDSALNTIVEACDRISDTARAHHRAFVVEVMGRECGYLAMASAVAVGADAVVYPERHKDPEALIASLEQVIRDGFAIRGKRRILIIKAEGVHLPTATLVERLQKALADHAFHVEVRGTVLGHLVRGGNPSYMDRMIAGRLSYAATHALLEGRSDVMAAWHAPVGPAEPTRDPFVQLVALDRVLEETDHLLDGTSPVTQRRLRMIEEIEGILGL